MSSAQNVSKPQVEAFKTPTGCVVGRASNATTQVVLHCTIVPSDDGYTDNLAPTKSFSGSDVLIVQNVPSVPVSKTDVFLRFDIADNLPVDVSQSGAKPDNASLEMYVRLMNFFYNATVEVHNASPANWTENTLTWNTMPLFDANKSVSDNILRNGTWARWDLTHLIEPDFNASEELAFAVLSSESSWRNLVWFDSKDYPLSNGTTVPMLDLTFLEPYLTIQTPYQNMHISVGASTLVTGPEGSVELAIPWGRYEVVVPDDIALANGTRAHFVDWSDGNHNSNRLTSVGNNVTIEANYGIQHMLTTYSPYGIINGDGWYFENTDATISIASTSVPVEGLAGWLGARYIFDHWIGACTGSSPSCNVLMDAPKTAVAAWRIDWSLTLVSTSLLIISAAILFLVRKRGKSRARLRATQRKGRRSRKLRRSPAGTRFSSSVTARLRKFNYEG